MHSKLRDLLSSKGYPQSLSLEVSVNKKKLFTEKFGKSFKYYDVASLTKIMVTTPLCMKLFEEGLLDLKKEVAHYLPFLKTSPCGKIQVRDLLSHVSGLEWWRPFYKELVKVPEDQRKNTLKDIFRFIKTKKNNRSIYSDLDFILLGWIIEEIFDLPLDEASELFIFRPLRLDNSFFSPLKKIKKLCAPTGNEGSRKLIQGSVHDDNAWSLGGVSGHAGVFSTVEDVHALGNVYLEAYNGKSYAPFKASTVKFFTQRAIPKNRGDWGLGFTLPSKPVSTGGTLVSEKAFGHSGFTGTSLWIDPKRNAVVTILSNRTYPTVKDTRFLELRRNVHDILWREIDERK